MPVQTRLLSPTGLKRNVESDYDDDQMKRCPRPIALIKRVMVADYSDAFWWMLMLPGNLDTMGVKLIFLLRVFFVSFSDRCYFDLAPNAEKRQFLVFVGSAYPSPETNDYKSNALVS